MKTLDLNDYLTLRNGAEVLEADSHGDKVLHLVDGNFLKLFRRKRLISSAVLHPYANRFARNTKILRKLGIPAPQVIEVFRIKEIQRDAVHYQPLPGKTIRQLRPVESADIYAHLGRFIAQLHQLGIYFRSLHLGNIVLTPEQQLGLIDIADLQFQHYKLGKQKRLRNFRHLLRNQEDRDWLKTGLEPFLKNYLQTNNANLSQQQVQDSLGI